MSTNLPQNLNSRMGCHCWGTNQASVAGIPLFSQVGCRWIRATRQTQMDVICHNPHQFNFADGGEYSIDLAIENGMSIMGILDARWGNETGFNDLPFASPIWEHLDLWEEFTTACVRHYKDRIKYWEIINEPPFFWWYPTPEGVRMPDVNPEIKRAPIWAYAKLLKASARIIRQEDPQARVVMGSGFSDGLFLRRLYELDCKDDFDVASVHYLNLKHPQDFLRAYRSVRQVMTEYGDSQKELWDTESGPGGAVIGQSVKTPAEYEGLCNIYRHCFAYEVGLNRYFWFNPARPHETGVAETLSVRDKSNALSPGYQAMKTLHEFVGEGPLKDSAHIQGEVHCYVFDGPQGPVSILWATAPSCVSVPGCTEAWDYLGNPSAIPSESGLTGKPLFIPGNILSRLDAMVIGQRQTVVLPIKQPESDAPTVDCPRLERDLRLGDPGWEQLPYTAYKENVPVSHQHDHFCAVTTSVSASVQMACNAKALYMRIHTFDDRLDPSNPSGLVQFTLKDSRSDSPEWSYFYNSYGLFNLYLSAKGPQVLRYEHIYPDQYPAGQIATADLETQIESDGILWRVRIPWKELGPYRPGKDNPCLMMFTFNRADGILDVPDTDDPAEWSHNFNDNFIVKDPALTRWIRFL